MPFATPGPPPSDPGSPSGALPTGADPLELTRLIGRTREVRELLDLLDSTRLVTLTGAGGSGKTRLALEVAGRLRERGDRVGWVELASLDDPVDLSARVLDAFGVRLLPPGPDPASTAALLGTGPMLLVLDNCEHVVDACAGMVEDLLTTLPLLRVLTTSREALGVRGERAWLVPALSLPASAGSVGDVEGAEAVQLFVERARDARSDFHLHPGNASAVAEICARLDGMPLAIELAAARVRVLTSEQIRDRLDDAFQLLSSGPRTAVPRHRTLQAAFQWSYDLLPPESRVLLRRLSVFRGTFDLDAVEAVAGGPDLPDPASAANDAGHSGAPANAQLLDGISRLADRSLLQMREEGGVARYSLLGTIRQYAASHLQAAGEGEDIRRRHAEHMLALAEAAAPHIFGGRGTPGWMERLEREDANLRAALEWALTPAGGSGGTPGQPGKEASPLDGGETSLDEQTAPSRAEIGLRLATALLWYWFSQGRFTEGRAHLIQGLSQGSSTSAPLRARARVCLAHLAFWQGEQSAVEEPAREALAELEGTDDPHWRAMALVAVGMAAHLEERSSDAAPLLDEAVALVRPLSHSTVTVFALYWQGLVARGRGEETLARDCLTEAAEIGAASGDVAAASHPLTVLGRILVSEGDLARARDCLVRGLAGHRSSHDRWGMVLALEGLAAVAHAQGNLDDAVRILAGSGAIRGALGSVASPSDRMEQDRMLEAARRALGPDRVRTLQDEGTGLDPDALLALAEGARADPSLPSPPNDPDARQPRLEAASPAEAASPTEATSPTESASATEAASPMSRSPEPARDTGRRLHVRALGPLEIEVDGQLLDPEAWTYSRPRELLIHLLMKPRGGTREEIGLELWPDSTSAQAKNSFHVTLHHLRKALGHPDRVVLDGDRYRLAPDMTVGWDAGDFEEGMRAVLERSRATGVDRDRLAALLALYRGDLLDGQVGARWLEEARDRLRRLHADGHLLLGRSLLEAGELQGAVREFEAVLRQEELNEEAHRGLMIAWARGDHRDRALRQFQRLSVILDEAYQAEPEEETRALHRRILDGDVRGVEGGSTQATRRPASAPDGTLRKFPEGLERSRR